MCLSAMIALFLLILPHGPIISISTAFSKSPEEAIGGSIPRNIASVLDIST